jgi:hypothetical protein
MAFTNALSPLIARGKAVIAMGSLALASISIRKNAGKLMI